jgi:hypothetical protein
VIVAKRAASALGAAAGFSLEGVDDLNIAVAQACEQAISAADRMWGAGNAILKLTFHIVAGGIEVEVRSLAMPESERQTRINAEREAVRLAELNRRIAGAARGGAARGAIDFEDLAVSMIRLFVDELRYNVDARGATRMRMVKYHVD